MNCINFPMWKPADLIDIPINVPIPSYLRPFSLRSPVALFSMRYYILHLIIVMTAMSQLFQDSSAGDTRLDTSDGTMLNDKSPGDSQQAQPGNVVDIGTSDQNAVLAIGGPTSPDSSVEGPELPNSGALQPDISSTQSNQPQPSLGTGDPEIPQKLPDTSTDIAQSCSAPPQRRMLLRPRGDSCPNIPSSTNYNPALYPGGEELYEKAKLWGVLQDRRQCKFWLKTLCCNGPRAFPTDINDCAPCMFWLARKEVSLCISNLFLTQSCAVMPTEPRCFSGGIYCCLGIQVRFTIPSTPF